ncbi:MAG: DUF2786 domain-containing protein [Polyangiaceae bacterium]|nr:DUF2786 domain-containing protein [Polyangiaceae bacterium]
MAEVDQPSRKATAAEQLTAELRRSLLLVLRTEYASISFNLFRGKLGYCNVELSDTMTLLGRYNVATKTIELQEKMVLEKPWGVTIEVLKHEMAHQYVVEVLGITDETSHGPAFRKVCDQVGIDASAAGVPTAAGAGDPEAIKVLERIAKLLALAESSNENEAQAAMAAAQRLMLKHNIDQMAARAERGYTFRHLGEATGRVSEAGRIVSAILGSHFFVECIWVPAYRPHDGIWGHVLEVCGTLPNIEMASYVHDFLHHTAETLWRLHKRALRIRNNRDRRPFITGVMTGFYEKLNREKSLNAERGLVWVKDADLDDFYRNRHRRIRNVRFGGSPRTEAHAHGRAAGRNIELHRPMGGGTSGPKLLGR